MKQGKRIYWRPDRRGRAWADFRDYADVGGDREPLTAPGEHFATRDPDVARELIQRRLKELDDKVDNSDVNWAWLQAGKKLAEQEVAP